MSTRGTVRFWIADEGWGVIDSPETPGGCWAHFSNLAIAGFATLEDSAEVELEWEAPGQDGFDYRATRVWPAGQEPVDPVPETMPNSAYQSELTITFDEN